MSAELDQVASSLEAGAVPPLWLRGYPSLKSLAPWTRDLQLRIDQLARWRDANASVTLPRGDGVGGGGGKQTRMAACVPGTAWGRASCLALGGSLLA